MASISTSIHVSLVQVFVSGHMNPELPVKALQTPSHMHMKMMVSYLDRRLNAPVLCSVLLYYFLESETVETYLMVEISVYWCSEISTILFEEFGRKPDTD